MKKFFKHDSVEVLQYLGRAYFRAGKLKEAKTVFLKVCKFVFFLSYKKFDRYIYIVFSIIKKNTCF